VLQYSLSIMNIPYLGFLLTLSVVTPIGDDCCCSGCPLCQICDDGCVGDLSQNNQVCGSITDGFGTRDLYCCNGGCNDVAFDDSNCGTCNNNCTLSGEFCCNGACVPAPC
jgi:hypothetical protein